MNHLELTTARKLIGLNTSEAAQHIGNMTESSWISLENDESPIPDNVVAQINYLINRRQEILKSVQQKMLRADADLKRIAVIYYDSADDCASVLDWRFSQSLAITLAHDYGARLVNFDNLAYTKWLLSNGMVDSPDKRSQWAAETGSNND